MQKYEIMFIYDLEEDSFDNIKASTTETFSKNDVKVIDEKNFGKRDFAFVMKKTKKSGHYYLFNVEAEQTKLPAMEKVFKLNKGILRYLIINKS